jgi:ribosomal protein S3
MKFTNQLLDYIHTCMSRSQFERDIRVSIAVHDFFSTPSGIKLSSLGIIDLRTRKRRSCIDVFITLKRPMLIIGRNSLVLNDLAQFISDVMKCSIRIIIYEPSKKHLTFL